MQTRSKEQSCKTNKQNFGNNVHLNLGTKLCSLFIFSKLLLREGIQIWQQARGSGGKRCPQQKIDSFLCFFTILVCVWVWLCMCKPVRPHFSFIFFFCFLSYIFINRAMRWFNFYKEAVKLSFRVCWEWRHNK